MGSKVLNIEIKAMVTTECKTYYKFAVMQTAEYFDEWLAGHMEISVSNKSGLFYGLFEMNQLSYYNEILDMEEESVFNVGGDEIIRFLIDKIDRDIYVILDLNMSRLYSPQSNDFYRHEHLVYGYDTDRQIFKIPMLWNGTFKETDVPFESIKAAFIDTRKYYEEEPERTFFRRGCFPCITLVKTKPQYKNINAKYDFIQKLKKELNGVTYTRNEWKDNYVDVETFYTGLSAALHWRDVIKRVYAGQTGENQRVMKVNEKSGIMLYEHRKMIYRTMDWFIKNGNGDCVRLQRLREEYGQCCEKIWINVMLFQKYVLTSDKAILERIMENVSAVVPKEKEILREFIDLAPGMCI